MRHVSLHVTAIALLTAGLAGAGGAEEAPLSACRGIGDDATRLACYDAIADGPQPPASVGTTAGATANPAQDPALTSPPSVRPTYAQPETAAASAEDLFGRDARQAEDMALRAAGATRIEQLTARVTGVRPLANGKLVLELDNGQVWSQVDSAKLRLKAGEDVRIRRAMLNSYLLNRVAGGTAIRVRRSQ